MPSWPFCQRAYTRGIGPHPASPNPFPVLGCECVLEGTVPCPYTPCISPAAQPTGTSGGPSEAVRRWALRKGLYAGYNLADISFMRSNVEEGNACRSSQL